MTDVDPFVPLPVPPAADRVAAGIGWLNRHHPGWRNLIDPALLDLDDACNCVLGQVLGSYWDAEPLRGPDHGEADSATRFRQGAEWARAHGFLADNRTLPADGDPFDSEVLERTWAAELARMVNP